MKNTPPALTLGLCGLFAFFFYGFYVQIFVKIILVCLKIYTENRHSVDILIPPGSFKRNTSADSLILQDKRKSENKSLAALLRVASMKFEFFS